MTEPLKTGTFKLFTCKRSKQTPGQQVLYFPLTRILTGISVLAAGYAAAQYWLGEIIKQKAVTYRVACSLLPGRLRIHSLSRAKGLETNIPDHFIWVCCIDNQIAEGIAIEDQG